MVIVCMATFVLITKINANDYREIVGENDSLYLVASKSSELHGGFVHTEYDPANPSEDGIVWATAEASEQYYGYALRADPLTESVAKNVTTFLGTPCKLVAFTESADAKELPDGRLEIVKGSMPLPPDVMRQEFFGVFD